MKLNEELVREYFGDYQVRKGVYESDIMINDKSIIAVDHYNNITHTYDGNIQSFLGSSKYRTFTRDLFNEVSIIGDTRMLYIKCDELKLVSKTYNGMSEYLYKKGFVNSTNYRGIHSAHVRGGDVFMFNGYKFEVIREGDIYE